jgi:hypothetical protein
MLAPALNPDRETVDVESIRLRPNPFHDIFGILKGYWEGIFWREAVLHIDDRVVGVVCDKAAVFIVVSERLKHESTAAKNLSGLDWAAVSRLQVCRRAL